MADEAGEEAPYLDEMIKETPLLFASSGAVLTIEDPNLHPMGRATAVFLLFICALGFLNGLDFASPDDGLIRPDEFVYRLAQSAPAETATFRGSVMDEAGQPLSGATVYLSWLDRGTQTWLSVENKTGENGGFEFENLTPGLIRTDIIVERDGYRDVYSNRVLLSPPALIEPIGFTTLSFNVPSSETFAEQPCEDPDVTDCEIREIDMTPTQMDHPLMDPSASATYVLVGFGFMGLALIAAGFSIWALKNGSLGLLRTSAGLSVFTMGHYYSACILGLLAFVLTFAIPRRRIPLTD
jgi:hypothetical protein